MSPPPLPDVHEAILDEETLERLFLDLAHAADVRAIVYKGSATAADAAAAPRDLAAARAALAARRVLGVQIRYLHGGREWWDTFVLTPGGVRLVRVAHGG